MNPDLTNTLAFKVAKLMIAIGWQDGNLDPDEINAMKHMLFRLKGLTAEDWARLEILMENSVEKPDCNQILDDVLGSIRTKADKTFVLDNIRDLIAADGKISKEEKVFYEEIEKAVNEKPAGLVNLLAGLGKGLLKKSAAALGESLHNEETINEYVQNKLLFDIKKKFPQGDLAGYTKGQLKKFSAGAGLLGRVAMADNVFDEAEKTAIVSIIETSWGVDPVAAALIGDLVQKRIEEGQKNIHKTLPFDYLARSFFEETDNAERKRFVELLFKVANASGKTSFREIELIRDISMDLKVSHKDYIDAKLTLSREDRGGM